MPAAQVLDSYALLACIQQEPGGGCLKPLLHKAATTNCPLHMTEENCAEVNYIIRRKEGDHARIATARIPEIPIEYHPATRSLANRAAL